MIQGTMEYLGYKPVCVSSAADALNEFTRSNEKIDLVVTDILLADSMNGFELGSELHKRFPRTKILYMSGYAQDALKDQGARMGNLGVLQKPFSVEKLAVQIAQLLPLSSGREIH